jgi:hypothetical protein
MMALPLSAVTPDVEIEARNGPRSVTSVCVR